MASYERLRMRLEELDSIERDIADALQLAGLSLCELGKEDTSRAAVAKSVQNFSKTLLNIEKKLSRQIIYLSHVCAVHPHEGSNYAAKKVFHMALHRRQHVRSRIEDLRVLKEKHQSESKSPEVAELPQKAPWLV